jgi:hypothetical protein
MNAAAAAGAAFLLAVLWFDLMFDVQVLRHRDETLPPEVLTSISAYYRRVTVEASPMGRLVAVVMVATLAAIGAEIVFHAIAPTLAWASLVLALSAVGLATARTVRNAMALGRGEGTAEARTRLARTICRDHFFCLWAISAVVTIQLAASHL